MFELFSDIPFVSLFLKFMIGSTVLLGAVWLLEKTRVINSPDLAELAWKLAIVGSFLSVVPSLNFMSSTVVVENDRTAAIVEGLNTEQPLIGYAPDVFKPVFASPVGNFYPATTRSVVANNNPSAHLSKRDGAGISHGRVLPEQGSAVTPLLVEPIGELEIRPNTSPVQTSSVQVSKQRPQASSFANGFLQFFSGLHTKDFVALGWIFLAVLTISALMFSYRDAVKSLGSRKRVGRDELASIKLRAICEKADIRHVPYLSRSSEINSPVCLPYREICLPDWAFDHMPEAEFESLLAHELGHMVRRDPLMLMVLRAISRIFFFQPLFVLARKRLTDAAELAADEWAAEQATNSRAVANALYYCATKIQETRQIEWGLAMAGNKSILKRRVERLIDAQNTSFKAAGALSKTALVVGALGLILGLPNVGFTRGEALAAPAVDEEKIHKPKRVVVIDRRVVRDVTKPVPPVAPVAPVAPKAPTTPSAFVTVVGGEHIIDKQEIEMVVREALVDARAYVSGPEIGKNIREALENAGVEKSEQEVNVIIRDAKGKALNDINDVDVRVIVHDAMADAKRGMAEAKLALADISLALDDQEIKVIVGDAIEGANVVISSDYINDIVTQAMAGASAAMESMSHSFSTSSHGGGESGNMNLNDGENRISVNWDGSFRISADDSTMIATEGYGLMRIKTSNAGDKRVIKFEADEGKTINTYWVNGKKKPLDADGRKWLEETLKDLIEVGFGVGERVSNIIKEKGVSAVFARAKKFDSDMVKRLYVVNASQQVRLKSKDMKRAIGVVESMNSDFEKRLTLSHLLEQENISAKIMPSVFAVAKKMDSDFEKRLLITHAVSKFKLTNKTVGSVMDVIKTLSSDFEKRLLLTATLHNAKISDKNAGKIVSLAIKEFQSDYELRLFLSALVEQFDANDTVVAKALKGAQVLDSNFERRLLLSTLIGDGKLSQKNWLMAIKQAGKLDSKHEKRLLFGQIKGVLPDNKKIIAAYDKASADVKVAEYSDRDDLREHQRELAEDQRERMEEQRERMEEMREMQEEIRKENHDRMKGLYTNNAHREEDIKTALKNIERDIEALRAERGKAGEREKSFMNQALEGLERAKSGLQLELDKAKKLKSKKEKAKKMRHKIVVKDVTI